MGKDFVVDLLGLAEPAPAGSPGEALRLLRFHGLEGLCAARSRTSERPLLPPDALESLESTYRTQGLQGTLLLESSRRARAVLSDAGFDSLVFKGGALLEGGIYRDPGARRMDDVDLLVRPGVAARAVEALLEGGFRPATSWDPASVGWSDAVALLDTRSPPGFPVAVDVHWRTGYDRLRFGGDRESILWEGSDPGTGLPPAEAHLVLVAEHLLKHLRFKIHLAAYGDLARLAERVGDWDRVMTLTEPSRLRRGIEALLAVAALDLGAPVPGEATGGAAGPLCRALSPRALVGSIRPREGRLRGIVGRWRLLGGPLAVSRDLADAAFPSRDWLRARYGAGGGRAWVRYVSDVLRWAAYRGRSPASPNQQLFDRDARD